MKRVLVVEDHTETREILAEALSECGYEIDVARCGADALAMFAAHPPDVVLLDIGLPDISGHDVALRMRALAPATSIFALSAWSSDEDIVRSRAVGIDLHVVKPVDLKTLCDLLESDADEDWADTSSSWPHENLRRT